MSLLLTIETLKLLGAFSAGIYFTLWMRQRVVLRRARVGRVWYREVRR